MLELGAKNLNSNAVFQKLSYEKEKPFTFLSSLGGKKTSYTQIINTRTEENLVNVQTAEENLEDVAKAIQIFSKLDMDKSLKSQVKRPKSQMKRPLTVNSSQALQTIPFSHQFRANSALLQENVIPLIKRTGENKHRPMTAANIQKAGSKNKTLSAQNRINSGNNRAFSARNRVFSGKISKIEENSRKYAIQNQIIEKNMDLFGDEELDIREDFEENDEFYEKAEELQGYQFKARPKSNLLNSRPISGRSAAPEQFFNTFTKFAKFNDVELPYEDLFDRNERTIAATYAKFGDLGYYSPVQRIGAYMQFSAKLKREHLVEIINLQKTSII